MDMATALLMAIAVAIAVFPEFAWGTISLSRMSSLYMPYGFTLGSGQPVYGMGTRGAVERVAYDRDNYRLYTVGQASILNVVDISNPTNPTVLYRLYLRGVVTDIDSCGNYVAMSVHYDPKVLPGSVLIFDMYDSTKKNMSFHREIQVGPLPDKLKFTKDCMTLVTCNEGEPGLDQSGNFMDPEGSATVITFPSANLAQEAATIRTATFRQFDERAEEYNSRGVRWPFPRLQVGDEVLGFNLSQTLEPEHFVYSQDETKAYVVLQENNAIAVLDLATARFDEIYPLGSKYWGTSTLDTSTKDGGIVMRDWPIYGLYQTDNIQTFSHKGRNYFLAADEGDYVERAPPNGPTTTDRIKGKQLLQKDLLSPNLKSQRVRKALNLTSELGCLVFSSLDGLDPLNPGKYSSLHLFGGRGISVWDADDISLVWHSGDDVERMISQHYPDIFNSGYEADDLNETPAADFDGNSCTQGPETESVTVGEVDGQTLLFLGNERTSTIMIYKLADEDAIKPVFQSIYWPGRADLTWRQAYQDRSVGDVQPENLVFVSASDSPTNTPLLVVAGTSSGTVSVYEVVESSDETSASPKMAASWFVRMSALAVLFVCTIM